jgi:hypothetical protein
MSKLPIRQAIPLTHGPKHHFFGYYNIQTWNASGTKVLCLEADFQDRLPEPEDTATVGLVDFDTYEWAPLAQTHAWNFQQGSMLHWLPTDPDRRIIYNDRQGKRFVSVVRDVQSGESRMLPRAINGLSHDGRDALCLNFGRLRANRPVCGYAGPLDPYADQPHPTDDGVFLLDIEAGQAELIVSLQDVYTYHQLPEMQDKRLWFNHTVFNTDDSRFAFLARWRNDPTDLTQRFHDGLFIANRDGSGLKCLVKYGYVSHFDWYDPHTLLAWMDYDGQGPHFYLLDVDTGDYQIIGDGILTVDGHCSFTQDRQWFLTDTYPDENRLQTLKLWNLSEERQVVLGRFYSPPSAQGAIRCDLHPRWDRKDEWLSFDSVHKGTRQVYVLDASDLTG